MDFADMADKMDGIFASAVPACESPCYNIPLAEYAAA